MARARYSPMLYLENRIFNRGTLNYFQSASILHGDIPISQLRPFQSRDRTGSKKIVVIGAR